jgi:hypothetical protein
MNIIFKFLFLLFVYFVLQNTLSLLSNYHPLPNADPNDPPNASFAAMGPNDSAPGVAAPTKGVESC